MRDIIGTPSLDFIYMAVAESPEMNPALKKKQNRHAIGYVSGWGSDALAREMRARVIARCVRSFPAGGRVLDLGCGPGLDAPILGALGFSVRATYGAFAYLLWSRLESRRAQTLMLAATVLIVTLIGFSRLYLGVHYLSDVLAGVAGGATWLALSVALRTAYGERLVARFTGSGADRVGRRLTRS